MAGLEGCSCAAASIRRTACCVCPRAARAGPSSCSASVLPGSRASTSRYSGTASVRRPWSWAARARASVAPLSATVACAAARGRRGYRVALHEIAECLLQPRKPGLVVTPLIDAFGIKRMSPRVNDRGTRKHQLDEAYMTEVAQHLIDEARLARGAIYLGPGQVARGETFDLPAPERGDGLGILRRFADIRARPQLQCERGDVGQFACALRLRMRRQNLFEQRRSGAWHTHDKNWIRSLAAPF